MTGFVNVDRKVAPALANDWLRCDFKARLLDNARMEMLLSTLLSVPPGETGRGDVALAFADAQLNCLEIASRDSN